MVAIHGGDQFEKAMAELARNVVKPASLRVGYLEKARYPNGVSIAMVAAIQNFGAPSRGIPPRPFFTNMVKDKQDSWGSAAATLLAENNYDAEKTLELMGKGISEQLSEAVIETNSPPLSPVTVMLRGMRKNNPSLVVTGKTVGQAARRVAEGKTNYGASTKVLVDSGELARAPNYEVKTK